MDAKRVYSAPSDRENGIICDQIIRLVGIQTSRHYPDQLRRIRFKDPETGKTLVFLTNQCTLPAATICALYKSRRAPRTSGTTAGRAVLQVDQAASARSKTFYGTSENAVKTQIWIAVSVYVLVAIVKKRLGLDASLYTLLQILSLTLFEKMPILQALSQVPPTTDDLTISNQLKLL